MKRILVVGLLLGAGCAPVIPAPGTDAASDGRISDQVRMKLATDADVKGGAFDVAVENGVVTIKGRVDTEKGKDRATKLAKKIHGVKSVDNELVVGPPK